MNDGSPPMAKKSRSVNLPVDVYEFLEAYETKTGFGFNRQVLAAILRLLFGESFYQPNLSWFALAHGIEKGGMSIEDLPLQLAKWDVGEYESEIKRRKKGEGHPAHANLVDEELRRRLDDAKEIQRTWESRIREHRGDARKAVMENIQGSIKYKVLDQGGD